MSILLLPWTGSSKVCPPTRDTRDRSLGTGREGLSSSYHGRVLQRFVLLLEITEIGLLETGRGKLSSSHHGRVLESFVLLLEITETGLPGIGRGKLSSSYHGRVLQRFVLLLEIPEIGHWELEEGNCPPPTMDGFFKGLSSY